MDPAVRDFLLVAGSGFATYFGAYWRKRGEDQAMKDGFAEVLRQVAKTTETTKKIEADISNDVWGRQKRWELKRDVLFEATRRMAAVEDGLLELDSILRVDQKERNESNPAWDAAKNNKILKWSDTSAAFDETRLFVAVV